jgi:hypothetical protein
VYVIDRLLRQGISLPEGKHQRKNQADEKPTRAYSVFRTQYAVLEQWKAVSRVLWPCGHHDGQRAEVNVYKGSEMKCKKLAYLQCEYISRHKGNRNKITSRDEILVIIFDA